MKKISQTFVFISLILISSLSSAATLSYAPSALSFSVAAGDSLMATASISIDNPVAMRMYYTWAVDKIVGNLPTSWIAISPSTRFLTTTSPSMNISIALAVPYGTAPGTYSGVLYSKAMEAHGVVNAGAGLTIQVTVPTQCSAVPDVADLSASPLFLWPPNHKLRDVSFSGKINLVAGCSLLNAGYSIDDEYGISSATGELSVGSDAAFRLVLPLEAWREGVDQDGRTYRVTFFAENESGISSRSIDIVVPHDQDQLK